MTNQNNSIVVLEATHLKNLIDDIANKTAELVIDKIKREYLLESNTDDFINIPKTFLTIQETANYLQLSVSTIRRYIKSKKLKFDENHKIHFSQLKKFLKTYKNKI